MRALRYAVLTGLLALSGCGDHWGNGWHCHDGAFTSFCVVDVRDHQTVVTGQGIVPAFGNAAVSASITSSAARLP